MDVVIVESPAKAKTINKYLGSGFQVLASYGHVRDLPSKDGSVKPDEDFSMIWEVDSSSKKRMNDIAAAAKKADTLYLATDPDREGEAISWHVLEILKSKKGLADLDVKRVVFNEITKAAVLEAMANPRELDKELVDAYLARRALDYLVGFTLSPVLWRKLPGSRSAGRVQSVALRLVSDRELEIEKFDPREYWTIDVGLKTPGGDALTASLTHFEGNRLDKFDLNNEAAATKAREAIEAASFAVHTVESKPARRNPAAPFTTSTLQQEAARKLGFSASRTMQTAQRLYEGKEVDGETVGLITYMRTDGVQVSAEAIAVSRDVISEQFGASYVPEAPRVYKTKAKNAQEAHEAVRPTDLSRRPEDIAGTLEDDERRLYELIWKRTIASQMESARIERTTAVINSGDGRVGLRATGSVLKFPGFLALYREGLDDADEESDDRRLPALAAGEAMEREKIQADQHFTEPPPRYSEASLVKKMEELGIGRPSTYASVLDVLRDRNYVRMDRNRFIPEDKGRLVTAFLESFFTRYVEYDFTANLEAQLDDVSAGKLEWKTVLHEFWTEFSNAVGETKDLRITEVLDALNEVLGPHVFPQPEGGGDPRACPSCPEGRLSLKVGRFGAFIGCSNYPDCSFTRQLAKSNGDDPNGGMEADRVLGSDDGDEISLKSGRFGPYVQRGDVGEDKKKKPPRASIPKDMPVDSIDLEAALSLLSLPRDVGIHPETSKPITAAIGRYGPYVNHAGQYASLSSTEEVFSVGINRAVSLLAEAKQSKRGGSEVIAELGEHPDDSKPVNVMKGRYGPYVKHNRINATIPKGRDPEKITLEDALVLIAEKASKPKRGKKKAAPKKAAPKKKASPKKSKK